VRSDKNKSQQSAQAAVDEDMLLQHISALNAKLTIAFEKKIEPLGNQIISYREVVAPLSQDLKRNLAILTPLLQQIQTLEGAMNAAKETFGSDRSAITAELASFRSDVEATLNTIEVSSASMKDAMDAPIGQLKQEIESLLAGTVSSIEGVAQQIRADISGTDTGGLIDATATRLEAHQADSSRQIIQSLVSLSERIGSLGNQVDGVTARSEALDAKLSESLPGAPAIDLDEKLSALRSQFEALQAGLSEDTKGQIELATSRFEAYQADGARQIIGRLNALTDAIERLTGEVGETSQSLTAVAQTITDGRPDSGDTIRAIVSEETSRLELAAESTTSRIIEGVEAVKSAIQNDMSAGYGAWNGAAQNLVAKVDALSERMDAMAETALAQEKTEPTETVYLPVGETLPDIIRDRVDEVHSRLSNSDWALQSIGKNMTTLMHEVTAMRDDVLSASMARRTYNAVEDIRTLVEDMPRRGGESSKAEELAARLESALESVRTAISARPDDLASTLEQAKSEILATLQSSSETISAPIDRNRQEILSAVRALQSLHTEIGGQISQAIVSNSKLLIRHVETQISEIGASQSAAFRTMASIESAALQKMEWAENYTGTRPKPLAGYDGSAALDQLKTENPAVFEQWHAIFQNGAAAYSQSRSNNCSTFGNELSRCFRDYLSLFAKGAILDIGCGPFADPAYLSGFKRERLTGLEPLDLVAPEKFPVVRGFNEFLPWSDKSFETIVSASSLDHVLDLRKALSETHRVLKSDGVYIVWYADVDGAENVPAKPPAEQFAVDGHHLFHISESWFGDVIGEWFDLMDYRRFEAGNGVADVFAVYRPCALAKAGPVKPKVGKAQPASRKKPGTSRTPAKRAAKSSK